MQRSARLLGREAVAHRGQSRREAWRAISVKVGSYCPRWENFRLTSEGQPTFTEKLRQDPKEFCGGGERDRSHRWVEACFPRRLVGLLSVSGKEPVGCVFGSGQRTGDWRN
jgi:hypothetical protein